MREHSRSNPFKSEIRPELRALIDTTAEIASALEREIKSLTRQWPVWRPGISRGLAPSIMPSGEWIVYSTMATHHAVVDTMSTACEALRSSRLEKAPSAVSILDELSLLVLSKEAL